MTHSYHLRALRRVVAVATAVLLVAAAVVGDGSPAGAQEGSVHYVAPDGDNRAAGTKARPWRTLARAFRQLQAGDTLWVRGGTYRQRVTRAMYCNPRLDGCPATARRPIHVKAYPGERPVVHGLLQIRAAHHWHFDGLNVTWDNRRNHERDVAAVKIMDGVGWSFVNAEIKGARTYANVYIGDGPAPGPSRWLLADSCIHHNLGRRGSGPLTDHNLYVATGLRNGPGRVENNIMFRAPRGNNIKVGVGADARSGSADLRIRFNTLFDATQNILVAHRSRDVTIERNILGRSGHHATGGRGKSWYPSIRGYELTGRRNIARDNYVFQADRAIRNVLGGDADSSRGVSNAGGNRLRRHPRFNNTSSCRTGFRTADRDLPFGARHGRSR